MSTPELPRLDPTYRTWRQKFADAFRGVALGIRGQSSFRVHLAAAALVVGLAAWLRLNNLEWAVLCGCVFAVLAAEMFNSSLEWLAKAVDHEHNPLIGNALDIASAAVLLAAAGAALAGGCLLLPHLAALAR